MNHMSWIHEFTVWCGVHALSAQYALPQALHALPCPSASQQHRVVLSTQQTPLCFAAASSAKPAWIPLLPTTNAHAIVLNAPVTSSQLASHFGGAWSCCLAPPRTRSTKGFRHAGSCSAALLPAAAARREMAVRRAGLSGLCYHTQ